jgi:hypothetical protein
MKIIWLYYFILFVLTWLVATPNMNLVYDLTLSRPSAYVTFRCTFVSAERNIFTVLDTIM